jgi:hypothetical protein
VSGALSQDLVQDSLVCISKGRNFFLSVDMSFSDPTTIRGAAFEFPLLKFLLFLAGDDCSVDQEESLHSGMEDQDSVASASSLRQLERVAHRSERASWSDGTQDTGAAQTPHPWGSLGGHVSRGKIFLDSYRF